MNYKIVIYICIFLIFVTCTFYMFLINKGEINDYGKLTKIEHSEVLIDVGEKAKGDSVFGKYTIYNIGINDLIIKNVKPDCNCTVSKYSRHPIKPHDSAIIFLEYNSSIPGVFQTSALVETNSETTPLLLIIRGNIIDTSRYFRN